MDDPNPNGQVTTYNKINNPSNVLDFNGARPQNYYSHRQLNDPDYIKNLKRRMAPRARDILLYLFPNGRIEGNEFITGDIHGARGRSLKVSLSPDKLGVGSDFATGETYADLIDLWASQSGRVARRHDFNDICEEIESFIGNPHTNATYRSIQESRAKEDKSYRGSPTATYYYTDALNCVIAYVQRYDYIKDGKKMKETIPWDGDARKHAAPSIRPLYNQSGIASEDHIVFVEGEKTADALIAQGIPATTSMGGSSVPAHKIDWSPISGKTIIIWPDADAPGQKYAEMVSENGVRLGCQVKTLNLPDGLPDGWDAADAIDEGIDPRAFIFENDTQPPARSRLEFKTPLEYQGEPEPTEWLVEGGIPLGVPGMVAAMGDTGKSYLLLDLCVRIACGQQPIDKPIFGGNVVQNGTAVYITSEDNDKTLHQRLNSIDPRMKRVHANANKLQLLPLPDRGGSAPLMEQTSKGIHETDHWLEIKERLLKIPDLKLVVLDPLQSFCLADVNADPAAGQYFCSMLTALASETGATVIASHHMRKPSMRKEGALTPGDVRELIRGTTALVDGMRFAYALWGPTSQKEARTACARLGKQYKPNCMAYGVIVKANGGEKREISTYMRAPFGLLIDRTDEVKRVMVIDEKVIDAVIDTIRHAAETGHAYTKTGRSGLEDRAHEFPIAFQQLSKRGKLGLIDDLLKNGKIVSASAGNSKIKAFFDVPDGPVAKGIAEFEPGAAIRLVHDVDAGET